MKKLLVVLALAMLAGMTGCSKVPAGNVGVKVYLLGGDKGVDHEVLGVGRYWIGINEDLFLFPTFQQNYTWTKESTEGSPGDESVPFQSKEGMSLNADMGISYSIDPTKVGLLFQKYRRGIDEITDTFLRNQVRDAVNAMASSMSVEEIYSTKKTELMTGVENRVREEVAPYGILIDNIYLIGSMRLPETVVTALNSKIEAMQRAQQRENEVAESRAQAAKEIAKAEGEAKAALTRAEAEAKANQLKLRTLTSELIQYEAIQRWNGALPQITSGAVPFINIDGLKK